MKKNWILLLALLCAGVSGFPQSSAAVSGTIIPIDIDYCNKIAKLRFSDFFVVSRLDGNMVLVVPTKKAVRKFGGKTSGASILSSYLKDFCSTLGTSLCIVDGLPKLEDMFAIVEVPDCYMESMEESDEPSEEIENE